MKDTHNKRQNTGTAPLRKITATGILKDTILLEDNSKRLLRIEAEQVVEDTYLDEVGVEKLCLSVSTDTPTPWLRKGDRVTVTGLLTCIDVLGNSVTYRIDALPFGVKAAK